MQFPLLRELRGRVIHWQLPVTVLVNIAWLPGSVLNMLHQV